VYSYKKDYVVPLILLDADIPENSEKIRRLTDQLYRSDDAWIKIMQRVILGMGGVAALKELGYAIDTFHMNEGHAVFSFVEKARGVAPGQVEELKKNFVYTCHTPVEAGHDRFGADDLQKVLLPEDFSLCEAYGRDKHNTINLTLLSMNVSTRINAVSRRHGEVMRLQFPQYKERIQHVTNGVHAHTWMSESVKQMLEGHTKTLGDFLANPMALAKAVELKGDTAFRQALWEAHQDNKKGLCKLLAKWKFDPDVFTICWARRFAAYKRPGLIMQDIRKLVSLSKKIGPLQIIFAGKAHPRDNIGFTFINAMLDKIDGMNDVYDTLKIAMPENYEISLARILTSSVDVWLNNPLPPFEASGTSGMKAILNGVVQLSTLDGWVTEAADKNIGRIFGYTNTEGAIGDERDLRMSDDSKQLYASLEELMNLYYATNDKGRVNLSSEWLDLMINCLAASADFNTYRMLDQYKHAIWQFSSSPLPAAAV
jgi:starch phosphorylase